MSSQQPPETEKGMSLKFSMPNKELVIYQQLLTVFFFYSLTFQYMVPQLTQLVSLKKKTKTVIFPFTSPYTQNMSKFCQLPFIM